jgi:hypothetical protein
MRFSAGAFQGHGQVIAAGEDGAKVKDATGREHGVHWHEMQGRHDGQGEAPAAASPTPPAGEAGKTEAATPDQPAADAKPDAPGGAKRFFEAQEVAALPDKNTVRQSVFASWETAAAIGPRALDEYKGLLDNLGKTLGFSPGRGAPDKMSDADLDSDESFIFMGPMKQQAKSTAKVTTDYEGDWTQLKDLVRATIAVKSIDDVHSALAGLKQVGLTFAQKPKDNMTHGTKDGYRDLNLIVKLPDTGMLCELQIAVKQISKVKGDAHEFYNANVALDQKRKAQIKAKAKPAASGVGEPQVAYNSDNDDDINNWPDHGDFEQFQSNRKRQQAIYGAAWAKVPGIDRILKAWHRARGKMLLLFQRVAT